MASSGTYSIGLGLDYSDPAAAEADIEATLTGNLTFEHNDEETSISSDVTFDTDTNGYLLKITAQSGDEHNGSAYGNGARITMGTFDSFTFDEVTGGDLADVEVSNLAFDITGQDNDGIKVIDVGGTILISRVLIAADSDSDYGIEFENSGLNVSHVRNSILYGGSTSTGIQANRSSGGGTLTLYNNTVIGWSTNIYSHFSGSGTHHVENNLCQDGGTDYDLTNVDDGDKNISEDATSPDASYRNVNAHDATSSFSDYANDDYRLVEGGSDNGTIDDGDDLSGTFTDDVIGTVRSTWWIGAFELATEEVTTITVQSIIHGHGVEQLTSTQTHQLSCDNVTMAQVVEQLTLLQTYNIPIDSIYHNQNVQDVDFSIIYSILIDSIVHNQTVNESILSQIHSLVIESIVHNQNIEQGSLSQIYNLLIQNITHNQNVEQITLSISGIVNLIVDAVSHSQVVSESVISQIYNLLVENTTHGHSVLESAIFQVYSLVIDSVEHSQVVSQASVTAGEIVTLIVNDIVHNQKVNESTIQQIYNILIADTSHDQKTIEATITQIHQLLIDDISHIHNVNDVIFSIILPSVLTGINPTIDSMSIERIIKNIGRTREISNITRFKEIVND
ncbi:MAG: hypothetical protein GY782_08470 [Gammaproteobacteria bacterium]|nr:hypothetical protein [Gammaproteobacteria bacterium]